jgi:glutamate/tyrosine decarboxylase-like PLP-dependent enzyme
MFGIKTKFKKLLFQQLNTEEKAKRFPNIGIHSLVIRSYLRQIKNQHDNGTTRRNLGWLSTPPNSLATWANRYFLDINPNHLGVWSDQKNPLLETQRLERESIHAMIDLYHGNHDSIGGYITIGGTEGNMYAAWTGNACLQKHCKINEICFVDSNLTHYSLRKIASIMNIPEVHTPLSPTDWNMDPKGFIQTITSLYAHGYRGFLVPLTLGYTGTGTCDDIDDIQTAIRTIRRMYHDVHFFLWIDAALNGLITPFLENNFSPFHSPLIQAFVVDFHKIGGVPYAAGMVLYRKQLRKLIEHPIDYLDNVDATIAGSRPGAAAAAIWTAIYASGKNGFRTRVRAQLDNKKYCISEILRILPETEIITNPHSLTCGLVFHTIPRQTIDRNIADKYGLFAKSNRLLFTTGMRTVRLYKLYFLPHMTRSVIRSFIIDMQKKYCNSV